MDYMEKITELRASKAKLNEQAQALVAEGKFEDANKLADQMEGINKQIQAVERLPLRAVYISRMQSRAFRRASALRRISRKSPSVVPLGLW